MDQVFIPMHLYEFDVRLESAVRKVLSESAGAFPALQQGKAKFEYLSDQSARLLLGGGEKPISKTFFNEIRAKGLINDYRIGNGGRVLYSREELINYIKSTKRSSSAA